MNRILELQKEFQKLLGADIKSQEYINQMFLGLFEETVEALKETKHKKHKKNQEFNKDKFIEELVDMQIYLTNLLLSVNMSWTEFELKIIDKQKINFERQKNNY